MKSEEEKVKREIRNKDVSRSKHALVPKIVSQKRWGIFLSFYAEYLQKGNDKCPVTSRWMCPTWLGHDRYKKELTVSIYLNLQYQYQVMYLKMWDLSYYFTCQPSVIHSSWCLYRHQNAGHVWCQVNIYIYVSRCVSRMTCIFCRCCIKSWKMEVPDSSKMAL